jgi:hypothetical protein
MVVTPAKLKESFGTVEPAALDAKARELGVELPAAYRSFLLASNGGKLERTVFAFEEDGVPTESNLRALYAWGPHPFYALDGKLRVRGMPGFPKAALPIGEDSGGNLVCLIVGEDARAARGEVWFWVQESATGSDPWAGMHRVAGDFDSFLAALRP